MGQNCSLIGKAVHRNANKILATWKRTFFLFNVFYCHELNSTMRANFEGK